MAIFLKYIMYPVLMCYECEKVVHYEECSWKQRCDNCSKIMCSDHRFEFNEYDDGALCKECMPICETEACTEKGTSILSSSPCCIYCHMYSLCGLHGPIISCPCGSVCIMCKDSHDPVSHPKKNHLSQRIYDPNTQERIRSYVSQHDQYAHSAC